MAYCGPRGIALSEFLRWPKADQDAALEWSSYEARRCKKCSTHPAEWEEAGDFSFHAHLAQCQGCKHQQRLSESADAQKAGRGIYAVLAHGPAPACPQCKPDDD